MDFRLFLEADQLGLQPPSMWGAIGRAAGRVVAGITPVGPLADLAYAVKTIADAYKQGKDLKPIIKQMMEIPDNVRKSNPFDLDDNLSKSLTSEAKVKIAELIINELKRINMDQNQVKPNLANVMAAKYLNQFIQKYANQS